jgi:hypothetical protein
MNMLLPVRIAGACLLALAVLNIFVPGRFGWKEELSRVSLLNRQIFRVHAFFIILCIVLMGALSLCFAPALLAPSPLSRLVLGGLSLFWLVRLFCQWFVYDPSLWRGNRFNTFMHCFFTLLWSYFAAVYGIACWLQLRT